ncbi:MAG: SUMF1/EgtB/PvdO family nonheme iron enzyme [Candidatus Omnitrophica bacterium]|nr:SUMF1/EgtB/PvdO family nonheme iron enzyme [Candidatus Omnitrophota bacterium]
MLDVNVLKAGRITAARLMMAVLFSFIFSASIVCAQSAGLQEELQKSVLDLQKAPEDRALREKIIALAQGMTPKLPISEEAEKFGNRAEYIIKNAKSNADLRDAAGEYEKALMIAPWVSTYYYNLAAVFEKVGQWQDAVRNYKLYLLAEPNALDAREVRKQIDGFEYVLEKAAADQKVAEASRVLIPAGEFRDLERRVFVSAYYIDMYEVTVAQYRKFCEDTGRKMPVAPGWGWQDDMPMVNVSWDDANAYAQHYGKRLPTRAEWEKAGLAGASTRYSFGASERDLQDYAWYAANAGTQPHPVGTKKANVFGVYDMSGNVEEWCLDRYAFTNYDNNPANPPTGQYPQVLGGGWKSPAGTCAILTRSFRFIASGQGMDDVGFRCVSSP